MCTEWPARWQVAFLHHWCAHVANQANELRVHLDDEVAAHREDLEGQAGNAGRDAELQAQQAQRLQDLRSEVRMLSSTLP